MDMIIRKLRSDKEKHHAFLPGFLLPPDCNPSENSFSAVNPFLLVLFLTLSNCIMAQNLLTNNGFETYSALPNGVAQYANATGWDNCDGGGSPDYFHMSGSGDVDLPICFIGTVYPYSGDGIMGFCPYYPQTIQNFREYISSALTGAMIPGNSYSVSFYINCGTNLANYGGQGIDKLSVAFTVGSPVQNSYDVITSVTPQWTTPGILYDTAWSQITFQFTAAGAYDHITFGNFVNDASTNSQTFATTSSPCAYYFIDEIQVQPDSVTQINFLASDTNFCEATCIDFTDLSNNNATAWEWIFPGGTPGTSSIQDPTNICYSTPGTYDVTLITTSTNGVDTFTLPAFITVNANPGAPVITSSNDTLYCSAASSYQWYLDGSIIIGATNQFYVATESGVYTVQVTNGSGCSASSDFLFSPVAFNSTDTSVCEKFCIGFSDQSSNNPFAWQWLFPGGTPSSSTAQNPSQICYQSPGVYDVTLITTNANGNDTLTLSNYITVNTTPPFPTITQNGYTLTSSPAYSYQWQLNANNIPGATNQSYTVVQSGLYTVIAGDSIGCVNSANQYVLISGVAEVIDAGISIYPNPSSGSFMVEFSSAQALEDGWLEIKVVNTLGQIVFASQSQSVGSGDRKMEIDLVDVARGVYFVEIKTGNEIIRKKIVIAH